MNTLDEWIEAFPDQDILSLEMIDSNGHHFLSDRHFRRPRDIDPLMCDLDQFKSRGLVGYICRPSGYRDGIEFFSRNIADYLK